MSQKYLPAATAFDNLHDAFNFLLQANNSLEPAPCVQATFNFLSHLPQSLPGMREEVQTGKAIIANKERHCIPSRAYG